MCLMEMGPTSHRSTRSQQTVLAIPFRLLITISCRCTPPMDGWCMTTRPAPHTPETQTAILAPSQTPRLAPRGDCAHLILKGFRRPTPPQPRTKHLTAPPSLTPLLALRRVLPKYSTVLSTPALSASLPIFLSRMVLSTYSATIPEPREIT